MKGSTRLKLTIDSDEALEDTLRVVGALYNVNLEVSSNPGTNTRAGQSTGNGTSTQARPRRASRGSARRRPGKRTRGAQARAATGAAGQVSTAEVRSWAREHGYTVADRGRVPAALLTAYRNAQSA